MGRLCVFSMIDVFHLCMCENICAPQECWTSRKTVYVATPPRTHIHHARTPPHTHIHHISSETAVDGTGKVNVFVHLKNVGQVEKRFPTLIDDVQTH